MEPCPIKLKTLEELEIISGEYGSYKGEFDYDAASKEMNGLWFTPDSDELMNFGVEIVNVMQCGFAILEDISCCFCCRDS